VSYESGEEVLVEAWCRGGGCPRCSAVPVPGHEAQLDKAVVTYAYSAIFIELCECSLDSTSSRQHHTLDSIQRRWGLGRLRRRV
jgi:hypothetical protein